jgi:hypothetical protein
MVLQKPEKSVAAPSQLTWCVSGRNVDWRTFGYEDTLSTLKSCLAIFLGVEVVNIGNAPGMEQND